MISITKATDGARFLAWIFLFMFILPAAGDGFVYVPVEFGPIKIR